MTSLLHRLAEWADATPIAPAQRYKRNGRWRSITAREYCMRVYHLALFLESRGFSSKEAGAIFAYNSPEWVHLDLAYAMVGAKSAGLYPNSTGKDIHYVLNHTEATVLGVQDKEYFKRITGQSGETPIPDRIRLLIVFDGDTSISPKAVAYETAIAEGRKIAEDSGAKSLKDYLAAIDPQAGVFMIYTSGTTGNPKGALLSHENFTYTADIVAKYWELPDSDGTLFSFLPLCHVAEKLQNVAVGITQRYTVNFCTKFENVSIELVEVQPTLLLCVPRLWEKMMEGVINKVRSAPTPRRKLAEWALAVGARVADAKYSKRAPNPLDLVQLKVADKLVLGKVRQAMGLGNANLMASGAAALAPHVSKWFRCLGLEILEDFGQTECTGVICMTEPGVESAGTVGKPVPGVDFKIADDGEILTKGRHVFVGYYKDAAATASTLVDGWLHTGDLGEINERGLVRIRGRKKEILKTSGGKMIAPLPIEERLKAAEIIGQVCMVGDGRKYLSCLITLSEQALANLKAKGTGVEGDVVTDPEVLGEVKKHISELNTTLAGFEQIKRYTVISRDFSIVDGEMTPTMKMKRNVIEQRFKPLIDSMYTGPGASE